MTAPEIVKLVEEQSRHCITGLTGKPKMSVTIARYVAVTILHEDNLNYAKIAVALDADRTGIFKAIKAANRLFDPANPNGNPWCEKMKRDFKTMYLQCIGIVTGIEDSQNQTAA